MKNLLLVSGLLWGWVTLVWAEVPYSAEILIPLCKGAPFAMTWKPTDTQRALVRELTGQAEITVDELNRLCTMTPPQHGGEDG